MVNVITKTAGTAPGNPFLPKIDAELIVVAQAEQRERRALDELHIASAEFSALVRQIEANHTTQGAYFIDRATGETVGGAALARANARREEADRAYMLASTAASQARGKLNNLQKAREEWERRRAYWADQAAQEAALTPAEREVRAMRAAEQRFMAAR